MAWFWDKIQSEPNTLSELVRQFMYLLLGFEIIRWTDAQQGLVLAFISGLLTFIVRRRVMPTATIEQAGQSVNQIKRDAAQGAMQQEASKTQDEATRQQVEATRQQDEVDKPGPRLPLWLLPLMLMASLGANCATTPEQGKRLQQVDLAVYTAISAVDDIEMSLYKTKVITEETHKRLNPVMLNTLKAGRAANDALVVWPRGNAKPPLPEFAVALDALNQLAKAVVDFTPEGPARDQLKSRIDLAVQLVRGILIGIGGVA